MKRHDRIVLAIGIALLALYLAQAAWHVEWSWLVRVQERDGYKIASGILLVGYLRLQWLVTTRRRFDPGRAVLLHRLGGALAPLVLYVHATRIGYGYLVLLVAVYLGTVMTGLVYHPVRRSRWLYTTWFIVHLVGATALIALVLYHAVIALAYE